VLLDFWFKEERVSDGPTLKRFLGYAFIYDARPMHTQRLKSDASCDAVLKDDLVIEPT
jgi:hypothetical protein